MYVCIVSSVISEWIFSRIIFLSSLVSEFPDMYSAADSYTWVGKIMLMQVGGGGSGGVILAG